MSSGFQDLSSGIEYRYLNIIRKRIRAVDLSPKTLHGTRKTLASDQVPRHCMRCGSSLPNAPPRMLPTRAHLSGQEKFIPEIHSFRRFVPNAYVPNAVTLLAHAEYLTDMADVSMAPHPIPSLTLTQADVLPSPLPCNV